MSVWRRAGGKVTRPAQPLGPAPIFPITRQDASPRQIAAYLAEGGNITFLTFAGVDHMGSAPKVFHIVAARDWLLRQRKGDAAKA